MKRKLYSEEHYSDAIKAQLAEMRAKRAKKDLEKQIAKIEKQIGRAVTEKFKESLAETLSNTSLSSKAKAKSIKTSTSKYIAKSAVSQKNKYAADNGQTAYTKKFAEIMNYAYEVQIRLLSFIDEFGVEEVLSDISSLFSTTSSEYLDYDAIQDDGKKTISKALDDIRIAKQEAEANQNTALIKILDEATESIEKAELLFNTDSQNTL